MKTGQPLSAETLGGLDLFAGLDGSDREALAGICTSLALEAGEPVVSEGDTSRDLYVVTEGSARVSKNDRGEPQELAVLQPGTVFGELSLVLGEPRSATVTALGDASVLRLDGDALLERQAAGDVAALRLAWTILGKLAARQAAMNREILSLSHQAQSGSGGFDDVARLRDKLFSEWSF